jgi:25S rRNA (adenine2142-N1)-methyltransferase
MPKARKRKTPITAASSKASSSTLTSEDASKPAAKRTRSVIRRFHVLLKRQKQLSADSTPTHTDARAKGKSRASMIELGRMQEKEEIEREIASLGGLAEYQRMSAAGQSDARGGSSSKILAGWLEDLGLEKSEEPVRCVYYSKLLQSCAHAERPCRLLDIGALRPDNYSRWTKWIDSTAMDLRSRAPGIIEQDFLTLDLSPPPTGHRTRWDVIALSLVLNFVPSPSDRGRMLRVAHSALAARGLLFLALPAPCVQNSRYLTNEHLLELLRAVGFEQIHERCRPGGRMAYWLLRKAQPGLLEEQARAKFGRKQVLRTGNDRNNFCIVI